MNRREFLQGAAVVGVGLLLPQATELRPEPLPVFNMGEKMGREMMESLAAGINSYTPIMMVGGDAEMYYSEDGGVTWEPVAFWSNREPSQEWIIETEGNVGLSAYDPDTVL